MVIKTGSSLRYFYHKDDLIKIRMIKPDTVISGKIVAIDDSSFIVRGWRDIVVPLSSVTIVYRTRYLPDKYSKFSAVAGIALFGIITINHLINNEQVFTRDLFLISGSFLAVSGILKLLKDQRCKTKKGWSLKVLEGEIR
jgi:hypothetical protein